MNTTDPTPSSSLRTVGILTGIATALFVTQLALGTAFYFAASVYASLLVVILTLRIIGFASIAGVLISLFTIRYLVLSQVAKTLYGQPGHTNLAAPDTTIFILFVGTFVMCAAAIIVWLLLGERKVISFRLEPATLAFARDMSVGIGAVALLSTGSFSYSDSGDAQYGGIIGIAKQFSSVIYFAIMAETWRVLLISGGQRSLSRPLLAMLLILPITGFAFNSKTAILFPFIAYLLASIVYRGRISRRQIVATVLGGVGFVVFIYPMVQILRASESAGVTLDLAIVSEFISQFVSNPNGVAELWETMEAAPDDSVYAQGLSYLGSTDDLLGRFLLIANADTIIAAVNRDGPYGADLIYAGFNLALPHFLTPDKAQGSTGDVVTWYYGLRSWGVVGYPANGLLADCYAAVGWLGVILIPFILMSVLFAELQLMGRRLGGNVVGAFFLLINMNSFAEANIQQFITNVLRGMPQYIVAVVAIFLLTDLVKSERARSPS